MTTLTGLIEGNFTDIDVIDTIRVNGDSGSNNQVLTSDGTFTSYKDPTAPPVADILTAGTGINITATGNPETISTNVKSLILDGTAVSGAPVTFNPNADGGDQTITINDTDTQLNLIAGSGINVTTIGGDLNKLISAKIDADTVVFNTGTELEVAKVPNALTAGTNISFDVGTTYDGSGAVTISSTDTDTQLNLTEGNGISITNTGGLNRTIAVNADGTTLSNNVGSGQAGVLKVPNTLTFTGYDTGTFDGSSALSINLVNTEYSAGQGIEFDNTTIEALFDGSTIDVNDDDELEVVAVPNALTAGDGITFSSGTTYDGSSAITIKSLPFGVFEVSGDLRMTINLANFMPDDDSSFYNIGVEDDLSTKIHGSIRVLNSTLEVCGYFIIPSGFSATACRIDLTNNLGTPQSRTLTFESFTTYGTQTYSSLGTGTTNSEQSFTDGGGNPTSLVGASDKLLLIRINTTATTDHIRGGYIKLTTGGSGG